MVPPDSPAQVSLPTSLPDLPRFLPVSKMTPELTGKAQRMYDAKTFTMAEIAASCGVTPMTIYRNISIRLAQ